jgi:hypothetical protein
MSTVKMSDNHQVGWYPEVVQNYLQVQIASFNTAEESTLLGHDDTV